MTHTPGPWYVMDPGASLFNGCKVVVSAHIEDAIVCALGHDVPGDEANGRLIAAAPDLLEALRAVAARRIAWPAHIEEQVTAAIAKAEGR